MTTISNYLPEVNLQVTTSWLPAIPTISPTNCASAFYAAAGLDGNVFAYDPNEFATQFATPCLPDAVTSWWDQTNTLIITSLGPFSCPIGYYNATQSVSSTSTFTACCPDNYGFQGTYGHGDAGQCTSIMSAGQILTYVSSSTEDNTYVTTMAVLSADQTITGVHANGFNRGVLSTSTPTPTSSSTTTPTTVPSSKSLSSGAIAGIAFGVAAVAFSISALCFWIVRRKTKETQNYALTGVASPTTEGSKSPDRRLHQVSGNEMPYELGVGAQGLAHELPAEREAGMPDRNKFWGNR